MTAYNKIGFHLSPGGYAQGLGVWMEKLDAAGIPFCVKGADTAGPVYEGQILSKQSGVPHVLVYRKTGQHWDVPDYSLPPVDSARNHWEKHRNAFPPELDKRMIWLETINEVDKDRADWLGHFSFYSGMAALREGHKFAAFGWSSGEPEKEQWELPGMLRYLDLCAQYPDRLAVALHEYSYTNDDIAHEFPYKVGRFQLLFDVCDRHNIARPTVLITEWGWEYNSVPALDQAIQHVSWAAKLYARHPEILGANLWHLGGGFKRIAHKAQKLIAPITDLTLNTTFPVPDGTLSTPLANKYRFVADVTVPDGAVYKPGEQFQKTWRIENSGKAPWVDGYELAFARGEQMGAPDAVPLPAAEPGEEIDLSVALVAPDELGTFRSYWQFRDAKGDPLDGRAIWAEIEVMEPEQAAGFDRFDWIGDATIPDGTEIPAGQEFVKTWHVCNTGTTTWKKNYQIAFVSGTQMAGPLTALIKKNVPPGQTAYISLRLKAPGAPGIYHGNWTLCDHKGESIGGIIWVDIVVPGDVPFVDGFRWPVGNRVNLHGWADINPFLRRNARGEYHPGADFNDMGWGDHDLGAPIYAVAHGLVTTSGFWPVWGNLILIEHRMSDGSKVWSQYAHCREMFVKEGDIVTRGQKIGTIGKGAQDRYWAHLHFELRRKNFHVASWHVLDPEAVKANYFDPGRFIRDNFA